MIEESVLSRGLYVLLVGAVALERVFELWLSRRNFARVRVRGGFVAERRSFWDMVLFQVAFLLACPLEVVGLGRPFLPLLGVPALLLVALAMGLRFAVFRALGDRWNIRLVVLPGQPLVTTGPYRFLRHPNYVALAAETLALPLVHTAWLTACTLVPALAALLARRIRLEEAALARHSGHEHAIDGRARLIP